MPRKTRSNKGSSKDSFNNAKSRKEAARHPSKGETKKYVSSDSNSEDSEGDEESSSSESVSSGSSRPLRSGRSSTPLGRSKTQKGQSPDLRRDATKVIAAEGLSKNINQARVKKTILAKKLVTPKEIRFVCLILHSCMYIPTPPSQ